MAALGLKHLQNLICSSPKNFNVKPTEWIEEVGALLVELEVTLVFVCPQGNEASYPLEMCSHCEYLPLFLLSARKILIIISGN